MRPRSSSCRSHHQLPFVQLKGRASGAALVVPESVHRHVVLGDVGRYLELVGVDGLVQVLNSGDREHLVFNLRRHKGSEPPGHYFGPQRWMHNVEGFQVLLELVIEHVVDLSDPVQRGMVLCGSQRVEVDDNVVCARHRLQQLDEVEEGLIEVDLVVFEPFADEDYDGAAQLVVAALIQAADAGDLAKVLCFGAAEQPFVPLFFLEVCGERSGGRVCHEGGLCPQ